MLDLLSLFLAALIGLSLGLIGGGGSILTVPVLVYVLHIDPLLATFYSLFIVGTTSLVGSLQYGIRKLIDYKTALLFAATGMIGVSIAQKWLLPAIPDVLWQSSSFTFEKKTFIMTLFASLMVLAALAMIRGQRTTVNETNERKEKNIALIMFQGLGVGLITGTIGAGGGFIIIPGLVLLAGLEMKKAVGSALLVICINTLSGFFMGLGKYNIDWNLLLQFTASALVGILIGNALSKKVSDKWLRPTFGYFVLSMGLFVLYRSIVGQ